MRTPWQWHGPQPSLLDPEYRILPADVDLDAYNQDHVYRYRVDAMAGRDSNAHYRDLFIWHQHARRQVQDCPVCRELRVAWLAEPYCNTCRRLIEQGHLYWDQVPDCRYKPLHTWHIAETKRARARR